MSAKIKLETKTNKKIEETINNLVDGSVKIGWFKDKKEPNGLLVAENAYMQNKGFTIKHKNGKETYVPPRPFMMITSERDKNKWSKFWERQYKDVAEGRMLLKQALYKLGIMIKSDIQDTIISSDGIRPNMPSTIEAKKRKGSPLIPLMDSRTMITHIDVESEVHK